MHSNESACRKKVRLGLEQVTYGEDFSVLVTSSILIFGTLYLYAAERVVDFPLITDIVDLKRFFWIMVLMRQE